MVIGLLFLLVIIGGIVYGIYDVIRGTVIYILSYHISISAEQRAILSRHFPYYNHLNKSKKEKFERRLRVFIINKQFVPRQMNEVTEEMKVLISATAIQLTFGLEFSYFTQFNRILVYPNSYYSEISKRYHNGEVNPKLKLIVISWKSFMEGLSNPTNGRNLGLHEMAHAIKLEDRVYPLIRRTGWREWFKQAQYHIESGDRAGLFREYAFTNYHEFFAVAVENFFERPVDFQAVKPDLYAIMVYMLRQDPAQMRIENM